MTEELYKVLGFPRLLHHYTSLDAICGGLLSKEGLSFRLTHYAYLNDKREFDLGRDLFTIRLNGAQKEYIQFMNKEPYYILAFSRQADFLPMWSMYGKNGNGIMLSLKTDDIFNSVGSVLAEYMYCDEKFNFKNPEHEDYIKEIIKSYYQIKSSGKYDDVGTYHIRMKLNEMVPLIKSNYFSYEDEIRLVLKEEDKRKVSYRTNGKIIIPYITKMLPKESLGKNTIGPTLDATRTKQSLRMYLDYMEYDDVKIEISNAPYRG